MAESDAVATPAATPKKAKSAKPKKPKTAPQHPKVAEMVNTAVSTLKERGGSSTQAIKKYISSHYKVDVEKLAPFIKKYLKNAVASGTLVQTKGKGASGSFKMTSQTKEKSSKPKSAAPKAKKAAKPVAAKKAAKPKTPKKAAAAKKPKAKPAKSPKKSKAAKPKSPKSKKAKSAKKSPAKKGKK